MRKPLKKKGQGISITVIIVAALGLLVLVILGAIFMGRIGIFGERVGASEERAFESICEQPGSENRCRVSQCGDGEQELPEPTGGWTDCVGIQVCCGS